MSWGRRVGAGRVRELLVGVSAASVLLLGAGSAGAAGGATMNASIDDRPIAGSTATNPVVLYAKKGSSLRVDLSNGGDGALVTHKVRVVGRSMGIPFFTYDYTLGSDVTAAPGTTVTLDVPLELESLRGQVLGLLPGEVVLVDPQGKSVASEKLVMDARGSLLSIYGGVGIAVGVVTVLAFLAAVVGLARLRLSPNRLVRGLRFSVIGIGIGLTLVFSLSMLRIFLPQPARCARIVVLSAVVMLALGFLTPRPPMYADEIEAREGQEPLERGLEPPA